MGYIRLEKDSDGIVELIFDQPGKSVNTMGRDYDEAMRATVVELQAMVEAGGVKGVYVRSGKPGQFFAGGDIKEMLEMDLKPSEAKKTEMYEGCVLWKPLEFLLPLV
jgi:3-hydroxyacyl-CoA dehydrogenase/enoyl-CoA hydratase/3-hydroxybutyryl-CoA epimerase